MFVSKSQELMNTLIDYGLFEEGILPDAEEVRDDMLQEITALRSSMGPAKRAEFDDFTRFINSQRVASLASGTVPELLTNMHPYQLQLIVQKFRTPAQTPEETPEEG